jgi:hypothetical protein
VLRRSWLWIREQFAFLLVLAVAAAAFVNLVVEPGRTGRSTGAIAAALLLAGVLRLVLATGRAGMLVVRGRVFDALCYLAMGGALLVLEIRLRA